MLTDNQRTGTAVTTSLTDVRLVLTVNLINHMLFTKTPGSHLLSTVHQVGDTGKPETVTDRTQVGYPWQCKLAPP